MVPGLVSRQEVVAMKMFLPIQGSLASLVIACAGVSQRAAVEKALAAKFADDGPGCVAAVMKDGKVEELFVRGVEAVGSEKRLTRSSKFYLASVSKQFTAACVHLLARRGKLGLDDDVRKHLPELPDYGDKITIRHLIHHRSGLRDYFELMVLAKMPLDDPHSTKDVLDLICRQKALSFRPGSEFAYSNSGYLLLAEIVRRVSGKSLAAFAGREIFEPLEMRGALFRDRPEQAVDGAALGHVRAGKGYRTRPTRFHLVGSGGVVASVDAVAKWASALDRGALVDKRFCASLEALPDLGPTDGRHPLLGNYAAGMLVDRYGEQRVVWHSGGSFGFSTCLLRIPSRKSAVIVMSNAADGRARDAAFAIAKLYFGLRRTRGSSQATEARPREGRFFFMHPRTGELVVSIVRASSMKVAIAAWDVRMRPIDAQSMVSVDTALPVRAKFVYAAGKPPDLLLSVGQQKPILCKGLATSRVDAAKLKELEGSWRSAELGSKLRLRASARAVVIADKLQVPVGSFMALNDSLLVTNNGLSISVERDETSKPVALTISTKRARGIRFVR